VLISHDVGWITAALMGDVQKIVRAVESNGLQIGRFLFYEVGE